MAFLRSVTTTTKTAVAASAIPVAFALSSLPSSSQSTLPNTKPHRLSFPSTSFPSLLPPARFSLAKSLVQPASEIRMDTPTSQEDAILPELLTEFMVDMKCEGCVNAVKNKLQTVDGVKNVEVDLGNQVVRVLGHSPVKIMTEALEQTVRSARLIGQGVPEDFFTVRCCC